jgi:hypothetical protein
MIGRMVFQLIQLPISIIFIAIFALVCLLVLWKLRKNGRVYRMLFWLCLAGVGVILFLLLLLVLSLI